jgi:hypothetical protein
LFRELARSGWLEAGQPRQYRCSPTLASTHSVPDQAETAGITRNNGTRKRGALTTKFHLSLTAAGCGPGLCPMFCFELLQNTEQSPSKTFIR